MRSRFGAGLVVVCFVLSALAFSAGKDDTIRKDPGAQPVLVERGKLAAAPTVGKAGDGFDISFALTAPNDVTVRIIDAKGEIVRHLASGMVGLEKAAKPFAPATLAQKIAWDGRDDRGAPLPAGKYSVKVLLGLAAKLDKFILDGHDTFLTSISAFGGSNSTGHVFVSNHGLVITNFMKEFDRDGNYFQTVWPPNPNMPKDLLEAFWKASRMGGNSAQAAIAFGQRDYDGRTVLIDLHGNSLAGPEIGSITQSADGRIIATNSRHHEGQLEIWDRYGRMMEGHPEVPWSMQNRYSHVRDVLTITSDPQGKVVYITDAGRKEAKGETGYIVACLDAVTLKPVEKFAWSGSARLDKPAYYLGTMNTPGDDESRFAGPTGAAVDDKARIGVADAGSLKVYDAEGKFLKRIDATTPGLEKVAFVNVKIGANYRTGAVFIATGSGRDKRTLYKLASFDDPKIVWQAPLEALPGRQDRNSGQIFVDSEANLVWVAEGAGKLTLLRVLDKGGAFETRVIRGLVDGKLLRPQYMRVDSKGNLFVQDHGRQSIIRSDVDGKTWKEIIKSSWDGASGWFCLDKDGNVFLTDAAGFSKNFRVRKFSPEGKPLNIGANREIAFAGRPADAEWGPSGRLNGVFVAPSGDIYVAGVFQHVEAAKILEPNTKDPGHNLDPRGVTGWVNVYSPEGELKKSRLVGLVGANDVQVGRDGIYTVEAGMTASPAKRNWSYKNGLPWTILSKLEKYSLEGGVEHGAGHLWSHGGVGYVNSISCGYECPGAQVCIDADDLVWTTEHTTYNAKVVDSAGNLVTRIGTYGNADCDGDPNGKNLSPAIPLAWPVSVARYKDYVLIADQVSARIARCRLEYAEEKTVEINK